MLSAKHVQLRISGRVQGVFYRVTAKRKADELGVTGFVKNQPDGSVYIEAEGEEESLYKFIKWCNMGPSGAQVTKVEVEPGNPKGFTSFDIEK